MVNQASDEDNAESIVGVPHDGHQYQNEDEDGDGQAKAEHEGPDFLARWHFHHFRKFPKSFSIFFHVVFPNRYAVMEVDFRNLVLNIKA